MWRTDGELQLSRSPSPPWRPWSWPGFDNPNHHLVIINKRCRKERIEWKASIYRYRNRLPRGPRKADPPGQIMSLAGLSWRGSYFCLIQRQRWCSTPMHVVSVEACPAVPRLSGQSYSWQPYPETERVTPRGRDLNEDGGIILFVCFLHGTGPLRAPPSRGGNAVPQSSVK